MNYHDETFICKYIPSDDVSKQVQEYDDILAGVAKMCYDKDGSVTHRIYSFELPKERDIEVNPLSNRRFENAYVSFPHPFEKGDLVRFVGEEKEVFGSWPAKVVTTSQEEWEEFDKRACNVESGCDYSDAVITIVDSNDETMMTPDHVNPIYLKKVKKT